MAASSARPGGKLPVLTAKVIGAAPVAVIVVGVIAVPTTPFASVAGPVMAGGS